MLLCGTSGSGKSTLITTLLYSLVSRFGPRDVNYYILDLSDGALSPLSVTPHCGAYLTSENEADFDRLLDLIREIIGHAYFMKIKAHLPDKCPDIRVVRIKEYTVIL